MYFRKINIVHPKFMKRYTIHPIIAYIVHLSGMEGAHINELATSLKKNHSADNLLPDEKTKNKYPDTQKQEFVSPSLQPSLRCQTHAFLPPHPLRG